MNAVNLDGFGWLCACYCYCDRERTDGDIPVKALNVIWPGCRPAKAQALMVRLVEAGLAFKTDVGWRLTTYLATNMTRAQIEALQEKKREAGKAGAKVRWGMAGAMAAAKSGAIAPAMAGDVAERWQSDSPSPSPVTSPKEKSEATTTTLPRGRQSRPRAEPNPQVGEFIKVHCEAFKARYGGEKYPVTAKDGAILKRLLGVYGWEKLLGLHGQFFASTDAFIVQAGHSLGVFSSVIPKLIAGGSNGHGATPSRRQINDPWKGRTGGEVKL